MIMNNEKINNNYFATMSMISNILKKKGMKNLSDKMFDQLIEIDTYDVNQQTKDYYYSQVLNNFMQIASQKEVFLKDEENANTYTDI